MNQASEDPPSMETLDYLARKMDNVLQGNPIGKDGPPAVDLHWSVLFQDERDAVSPQLLHHFVQSTRRQRLAESLLTQFPLIPRSDHPFIFPLYTPHDFEVVVSWAIPFEERYGFMIVSGLTLGANSGVLKDVIAKAELGLTSTSGKKVRNMYAETTRERETLIASVRNSLWNRDEDPLVVDVQVVDRVEHDFTSQPLSMPVTFNVRNTSMFHSAEYLLSLSTPQSQTVTSRHPLPRYIGALNYRGKMPPSSWKTVQANIWIVRPGVYSLGGWRVDGRLVVKDESPRAATFSQIGDGGKILVVTGTSR